MDVSASQMTDQKSDHKGLCSMFAGFLVLILMIAAGSFVSLGVHAGLLIPAGMSHVSDVMMSVPVMVAGSCLREIGLCCSEIHQPLGSGVT